MSSSDLPDWRDATAYDHLVDADRSLIAWEWLRRNSRYRSVSASHADDPSGELAARWGLHRLVPFDHALPIARPIWRKGHPSAVLEAVAEPWDAGPDSIIFDPELTSVVRHGKVSHVLCTNGYQALRLDLVGPIKPASPLRLTFALRGFASLAFQLRLLERLRILRKSGRFPVPEGARQRRQRMVTLLRVADALAKGANQRDIAARLISSEALDSGWREKSPSIRLQAQRMVKDAKLLESGAYRKMLEAG